MRTWKFFLLLLTFVYYLFNLILTSLPFFFTTDYTELVELYDDMVPLKNLRQLLAIHFGLQLALLAGLLMLAIGRTKAGLIVLTIIGGLWLALQFSTAEGFGVAKPFVEMVLLLLCIVSTRMKPFDAQGPPELVENADDKRV